MIIDIKYCNDCPGVDIDRNSTINKYAVFCASMKNDFSLIKTIKSKKEKVEIPKDCYYLQKSEKEK